MNEADELIRDGSQDYIRNYFYRDGIDAALLDSDWARAEGYADEIEISTGGEPVPFLDFWVGRGRTLAAYGRGDRDGATMQKLQRLHDETERVGLKSAMPALEEALSLT